MRRRIRKRVKRSSLLLAAVLMVTGVAAPFGGSTAVAEEIGRNTYEVEVGHRLNPQRPGEASKVLSTSMRFFPNELDVHQGDLIHFWGRLFLVPVFLLPPPYEPTTTPGDPHAWLSKENGYAHDLDDPWFFVNFDPDDARGTEEEPATKVNNRVIAPPPGCGASADRPCSFPRPEHQAMNLAAPTAYRPGKTVDPVHGVLSSGSGDPNAPRTDDPNDPDDDPLMTNLWVQIDAEPGTTIYGTTPTVIGMNIKINVVPDSEPATDPSLLERARLEQIAADKQTALAADARYSDYDVTEQLPSGATRHHALVGLEVDDVTILQAYPRDLRVQPGDEVVWHSDHLPRQYHTVTFPEPPQSMAKQWPDNLLHEVAPSGDPEGRPLFKMVCDLDTDAGSAPDTPTTLLPKVFCPGAFEQLEIELPNYIVYKDGDGSYDGRAEDWETSGVVGAAAPPPAPGPAPFSLTFPTESSETGFPYVCLLHPGMMGRVFVGVTEPSEPRNLTATVRWAGPRGHLDLTWDPPSRDGGSDITGYRVYRETQLIAELSATARTYSYRSTFDSATFSVAAVNAVGEGAKAPISVTRPCEWC